MEAPKLRNFVDKETGIVRRNFLFVAEAKSIMKFSVAFEKEHAVSFLAAQMADNIMNMFLSNFQTSHSSQTY